MAAKGKKKLNFFKKLMLFLNIISVIMLLGSYASLFISPEKYWVLAFFGLGYPVILIFNIFFVLFWIFVRIKYSLISLAVIIAGLSVMLRLVQFNSKTDLRTLKNTIKVISFNARNFDLYNYDYKNNWAYNFTRRNKIYDLLIKENADIICFQEYVYDATHTFKTTDTLKDILETKNVHTFYTANSKNLNYFGIATFTRFPVIDTGSIAFNTISGNVCIYTDVLINKDTVRIYNSHFESIRMHDEDYLFASDISKNNLKNKEIKKGSERILKRLRRSFALRAPQAELVAEHIRSCPYTVILCSDFNDTPVSYSYQTVARGLSDAFIESGRGTGQSYVGIFPSFRIDFILHSKDFKAYNYETIYGDLSDHYPIKCYLKKVKD